MCQGVVLIMPNKTDKPQNDETTIQKEEKAFKLRAKGWSQDRIASHLKMTQQGVSKALKRITKRFCKHFLEDVAYIKNEQIAQLEHVAHEAINAWYKSKEVHKTKRTKVKGARESGERSAEKIDSEEEQYGDPRFLAEFRKAKEDIRKIIGTDLVEELYDDPITEIKINIIQPEIPEDENKH